MYQWLSTLISACWSTDVIYVSLSNVNSFCLQQVEMGPFKHTVDDGLDIRKAAFECMYTLLDSCLDRLDIFEFLNHVEDGLKDHYDIKVRFVPVYKMKALSYFALTSTLVICSYVISEKC